MSGSEVLEDTHKMQPIGLATHVVYPAVEVMNALAGCKTSIWNANEDSALGSSRGVVRLNNLMVALDDVKVIRQNALNKACVQVLTDVCGIDGTHFGLPSSIEVKKDLIAAGKSEAEAELEIANAYKQHIRVTGVSMSEHAPQPGEESSNTALTDMYEGQFRFYNMYVVEPGDLMEHFIPTPSQMDQIDYRVFAKYKMWGDGQVPVLLRPLRLRNIADEIQRSLHLYVSHPDIQHKLYGTRYLSNAARANALYMINQYQKMIVGLGMAAFMKETSTALQPVNPSNGTDKLSISSPYRDFNPNLDFVTDLAGARVFRLNKGGNCKWPELRRLLYKNKTYNRVAQDGDNENDIVSVTDHDAFLAIWGVLNSLIEPGEVIPGSFEGLVGEEFERNRLYYQSVQRNPTGIMEMSRREADHTPLSAAMQWNVHLLKTLNLPVTKAGERSVYEVGDVEDDSGNPIVNIAKKDSAYGRTPNLDTELGCMLQAQEILLSGGVTAFAQMVQLQVNNAPARCLRKNSPGQLGTATMIGTNHI